MAKSRPLVGQIALITGSGRRIGQDIALTLAAAGADVAVHYFTSEAGAEETVTKAKNYEVRAVSIQADLSTPEGVESMFAEHDRHYGGKLDILVNSAARYDRYPFEQLNASRWQQTLALNLTAPFLCAREAALRMRRKTQVGHVAGHIINMADIAADRPLKGYAHYCVSKAGIVMLTKALALELAPEIRVNGVAPGPILPEENATMEEQERAIARVPLQTWGSPEAVSAAVRFLVADSDYMTGEIIHVDGGRSVAW